MILETIEYEIEIIKDCIKYCEEHGNEEGVKYYKVKLEAYKDLLKKEEV